MKQLPDYPRVGTNDLHVVIHYEDGSQELWKETETEEEARSIASRMEISLRVIKYVASNLDDNLSDIRVYLESLNIPEDIMEDSIAEGLYGVSVQHFRRFWTKPAYTAEQAKLKSKNGSMDHLLNLAVLLRERENYFREKRESVEALLKQKLDSG